MKACLIWQAAAEIWSWRYVPNARLAAKSGCPTLIASGESDNVLARLMSGELLGTLFITDNDRITAHQQWLAAHLQTAPQCWMRKKTIVAC